MALPETVTLTRDVIAEIPGAPVGHGVDLAAGTVLRVVAVSVHGHHWHVEHEGHRLIVERASTRQSD